MPTEVDKNNDIFKKSKILVFFN